jgi:hypothetical protein
VAQAITAKHRKRQRGQWQWVHSGRDLLGIVEQQPDGRWATIALGVVTGSYPTREAAIAALAGEEQR